MRHPIRIKLHELVSRQRDHAAREEVLRRIQLGVHDGEYSADEEEYALLHRELLFWQWSIQHRFLQEEKRAYDYVVPATT